MWDVILNPRRLCAGVKNLDDGKEDPSLKKAQDDSMWTSF